MTQLRSQVEGGACVWRWQTDKEPTKLDGLSRGGQIAKYLQSGELLIGSSTQNAATIHDVESGKLKRILRGETTSYYREGLGISPDGKHAAIPANKSVEIFDIETGELVKVLDCGSMQGRGACYSPDGKLLAAIGGQTRFLVWDLETGEDLTKNFAGHNETSYSVMFTPDGKNVLSGESGGVFAWETRTGKVLRRFEHEPGKTVVAIDVSPDGRQLLTNALDDSVRLWDIETGKEVFKLFGHGTSGGSSTSLARFVGGNRLCTYGYDSWFRMYDRDTGKLLVEHALQPNGKEIRFGEDGEIKNDEDDVMGRFQMGSPAVHPDGNRFYLGSGASLLEFDTTTGKLIRTIAMPGRQYALSPDGKHVALSMGKRGVPTSPGAEASTLVIIDLASEKTILKKEIKGYCWQPRYSADGTQLITSLTGESPSGSKHWVAIFDATTGEQIAIIDSYDQRCSYAAGSSDGSLIAGSYNDSSILVWDSSKLAPTVEAKE